MSARNGTGYFDLSVSWPGRENQRISVRTRSKEHRRCGLPQAWLVLRQRQTVCINLSIARLALKIRCGGIISYEQSPDLSLSKKPVFEHRFGTLPEHSRTLCPPWVLYSGISIPMPRPPCPFVSATTLPITRVHRASVHQ